MRSPIAVSLILLCLAPPAPCQETPVLTGIDVLKETGFAALRGRKVGLITNQTGIDRSGTRTVDILHGATEVDLRVLFSPEHGFQGVLERSRIADATDSGTGLVIFSLYGETRKPTAEMLQGIDTLVFDIQDIGCRFYTYISTMGLAMEAAAEHGLRFIVLDRPNPLGGLGIEGPVLDPDKESFVGYHPIAVRHGLTVGELALMFRAERDLELDLEVVQLRGWKPRDSFDRTGLYWVNPSPNMRSLTQAMLYPGIGLLETTNLSVGRGTDTPFEVIGAPWIDGVALAAHLNAQNIDGVRFVPIRFTPDASKFAGESCSGVNIIITDWRPLVFKPVTAGLFVACALRDLFGEDWNSQPYLRLLGNDIAFRLLREGASVTEILDASQTPLQNFAMRASQHFLYER